MTLSPIGPLFGGEVWQMQRSGREPFVKCYTGCLVPVLHEDGDNVPRGYEILGESGKWQLFSF
jgi:hypothetical protein